MSKTTKRLALAYKNFDRQKRYDLTSAIEMVKEKATAKFDETIEVFMNLGVDPRHSDQIVQGFINLPHGNGKNMRIAVFASGNQAEQAKKCGISSVGTEDLAEDIQKDYRNYDRIVATPNMMQIVGTLGKILGPRGLMPNRKFGTVTDDIATTVNEIKLGRIQFKTEKNGIISAGIGKASFKKESLLENIKVFIDCINRAKPKSSKGQYLKSISISSSMGPGIKVSV